MSEQFSQTKDLAQPLLGQVAVVTGASAGIGQAYAAKLAGMGADIASGDLNESSETRRLVEGQGRRFLHHHLDVADQASVTTFASEVVDHFSRVDILINNAGIYPYTLFDEMTFAEWRQVMSVDLDGPFLLCKAFVPVMRKAGYGRIVNVCSAECWTPAQKNLHYISAKMGVLGLTRALASETGDDGILVNCIAPGITNTQTTRDNAPEYLVEIPKTAAIKRAGEPEDMAKVIGFLASPENTFVTGQVVIADGGVSRI